MPISFELVDRNFWDKATASELTLLDYQELFDHIFCGSYSTTIAFLDWLTAERQEEHVIPVSTELQECAINLVRMLNAPLSYANEDCDINTYVRGVALTSIPFYFLRQFAYTVANQRR